MTRSAAIQISEDHRRTVLEILRSNLPRTAKVWIFGSRAAGRARPYSDLDLVIDAGRPLRLDELGRLAEAFCESELPYRVDVADWQSLDRRFRHMISAERVALNEALP